MNGKVSQTTFAVTLLCLGMSAFTNVLLAVRVYSLRATNRTASHMALSEGDRVPSETLGDLQGGTLTLTYPTASPTIVYVMSPQCGWCERNTEPVSFLAKGVSGSYRFMAVSLTSALPELKSYVETHHVQYPLYIAPASFSSDYKAAVTPTTIVIGKDGRVLKVWRGVYMGRVAAEIESYFGFQLPRIVAGERPEQTH